MTPPRNLVERIMRFLLKSKPGKSQTLNDFDYNLTILKITLKPVVTSCKEQVHRSTSPRTEVAKLPDEIARL